ncbi:MAG: hypothetical protein ABR576_09570 [Thermoanaerobaculia bacterium]
MRCKRILVAVIVLLVPAAAGLAQPVLTTGATPYKMTRTPGGNFVLAESGTGANDGRVTSCRSGATVSI